MKQTIIFFGGENQNFEITSDVKVDAAHCDVKVEAKGILAGKACAAFIGNIEMTNKTPGSAGKLAENILLLSPDAKIKTIPGLKINTSEAKVCHSAGITSLDDEELFYAGSRGIEENKSLKLIAEGFLKPLYAGWAGKKTVNCIISKKLCSI